MFEKRELNDEGAISAAEDIMFYPLAGGDKRFNLGIGHRTAQFLRASIGRELTRVITIAVQSHQWDQRTQGILHGEHPLNSILTELPNTNIPWEGEQGIRVNARELDVLADSFWGEVIRKLSKTTSTTERNSILVNINLFIGFMNKFEAISNQNLPDWKNLFEELSEDLGYEVCGEEKLDKRFGTDGPVNRIQIINFIEN